MIHRDDYRLLISTDTYKKNSASHLLLTAIPIGSCGSLRECVEYRDKRYKDFSGIFGTDKSALKHTKEYSKKMNKSLVCIINANNILSAHIIHIENEKIYEKEVKVYTANDVNYDLWVDPEASFWNSVDFLLEDFKLDVEEDNELIFESLSNIYVSIEEINNKINILIDNKEKPNDKPIKPNK